MNIDLKKPRLCIQFGCIALAMLATTRLAADTPWTGVWNAESALLAVSVYSDGKSFVVDPIETMGLVWETGNGRIEGENAIIEVSYQGVNASVLISLLDMNTAVARPLSCQPDYHVVCALVRNQQARFVRASALSD